MAHLAAAPHAVNNLSDSDQWELYQAILEVSSTITSTRCLRLVYKGFADKLTKLLDFDRANITLVDEAAGTVEIDYHFGEDLAEFPPHSPRPLVGTRAHKVLLTGQSIIENDITTDGHISAASLIAGEYGLQSSIAVPLLVGGRMIGMLSLRSYRKNAFGPREQSILECLADLIAPSVERGLLEEKLQHLFPAKEKLPEFANNAYSVHSSSEYDELSINNDLYDLLTSRECQVLEQLSQGSTNDEIAEELRVSPNTVKTHVRNILSKLQVPNRIQAALWARNLLRSNARTTGREGD